MPMYACTWADGQITFIFARTRKSAMKQLNREFDTELPFEVSVVNHFMATFNLEEDGGISYCDTDDRTSDLILDKLFPEVGRAISDAADEFGDSDSPEGRIVIRKAVEEGRARIGRGGADAPGNMQWQTKAEAKAKDKIE